MADYRTQQPLNGEADDTAVTQQLTPPTKPIPLSPTGQGPQAPTAVQPTTTSPLPLTTAQPIAPVSASDPLAFASSPAPLTNPIPLNSPTMPGGTPAPSAGYGGTGQYGDLSYADAVQAAYRDQQARMNATGVEEAPIDYSEAGLNDAGLWGMSGADTSANAARTASIQSDPSSVGGAKALAGLDGYATPEFDRALNNGSNPDLAAQVQNLLGQSHAEHVPTPAPTGYKALVNGQYYDNPEDALKAEQSGATGASGAAGGAHGQPGGATNGLSSLLSSLGISSPASGAASGAPGASASGGRGVSLTPTDPNNPLTSQTITPGDGTDRFKIARDEWDNFVKAGDPVYQASLRDATRHAFGQGRGVSGQLRTSLGDLAANRDNALDTQRNSFLNSALTGSLDDAYKNLGIAQQQQGFQAGQQQQGFQNEVTRQQLEDYLTNSAFGRAQGQEQAGYANDPSQIALILSQIFGSQATGAGNAAAGLFQQAGQGSQSNDVLKYLLNLLGSGGGGGGGGTVDTSGQTPGYPGNP